MQAIEYRDISEFPGYVIGEDGSVWSHWKPGGPRGFGTGCRTRVDEKQQMSYHYDIDGYVRVRFPCNGKRVARKTAVLILQYFVGPRPTSQHHAAHRDGNKENNRLSNLYWATPKQNGADKVRHNTVCVPDPSHPGERNGRAKLTEADIRKIRNAYATGKVTQQVLADQFSVTDVQISSIVKRKQWRHII